MTAMRWAALLCLTLAPMLGCGSDDEARGSAGSAGSAASAGSAGAGGGSGSGGTSGAAGSAGGAGQPAKLAHYLYVANRDGDSIDIFSIADSGALASLGQVSVPGPAPLAVSPDRERLYAGLTDSSSVVAYGVDFATGALTPIETASIGVRPVYLAPDATGKHLLVASYSDNAVHAHAIAGDGSVAQAPESTHSPGTNPHAILAHPSNQWAYVPVTNSDLIAQYALDAASGALSPLQPPSVATGTKVGPRHLVFHPTLDRLYVVNEHADSVTVYAVDPQSGQLSPIETEDTLPAGVDGANNTCADIHITPDGKHVYASNRGHDSLAGFSVDPTSGELTPIGHTPTEPTPREFELTPDGRFLYAAGQASGKLAAYAIGSDGTLSPIDTYSVGAAPLWVLAISVPAP
jgi:6-phosphogluconolactonase